MCKVLQISRFLSDFLSDVISSHGFLLLIYGRRVHTKTDDSSPVFVGVFNVRISKSAFNL